jgi:diguanylate cyclase (GGDEF)-like protein/PAS domain S-box-containing protein
VEQTNCCEVTPSRGAAADAPGPLLSAAWREHAELSGPACVLQAGAGVLTVAWVNRELCGLLTADAAQLTGRSLRDVADLADLEPGAAPPLPSPSPPGDDQPLAVWPVAVHRLARGSGGSAIARVQRPDGTTVRVRLLVTPVRPAGPAETGGTPEEPAGWLVTLEPLGEGAHDVQAALVEAEHRFTALASFAPVAIFASEAGLRLGYVNERFVALTGIPAHRLLGNGWLEAVHRDDLSTVYTAVQTVLGGRAVELTVRLDHEVGSENDAQTWLRLRFSPTTTPARAAGFIGTAEDVTQQRSWEEHLTYQARHDPLTGLVNRRRLIEVLGDLLGGRRARDRDFAILFLDLDGFKEINDTYGHETGDRALIEVARRMQRTIRDTDMAARVAGDEFVVVLRNITCVAEAEAAARRHLAALAAPLRIGTAAVGLSASVGIALPRRDETPESLLHAADQGMYRAKSAGSGLYRLAPEAGEDR